MIVAGLVLAACGSVLLVVAAAGLFLLPDALARAAAREQYSARELAEARDVEP